MADKIWSRAWSVLVQPPAGTDDPSRDGCHVIAGAQRAQPAALYWLLGINGYVSPTEGQGAAADVAVGSRLWL
jgi:hypothetical protein